MKREQYFNVVYLHEANEFLKSLPLQARKKIYYNILKVAGGVLDNSLFKKLEGTDIWEFRTLYNGIQYRLLAFWDTEKQTIVVATNGFIKKSWLTPKKEITKAKELRRKYFESNT